MLIKMKTWTSTLLAPIVLGAFLSSCGGGGGGEAPAVENQDPSPEFIKKAEAITFSKIQLYNGHVDLSNPRPGTELDGSKLKSGDLITVGIEFELKGDMKDYSLAIQMLPDSIYNVLGSGNTLGEVINEKVNALNGEGALSIGGAYVSEISKGIARAVIHTKIPALEFDGKYKIAVTPNPVFLSSGKAIKQSEFQSIPVYIDNRELNVASLKKIALNLTRRPNLTAESEFTAIEIGGSFNASGYTEEPLFKTSVDVNLTSFDDSQDIVLKLSWTNENGITHQLGLLSYDAENNPLIDTTARFTIKRTGASSYTIPVVVYAQSTAKNDLLLQAVNIKNIANETAENTTFVLEVLYDDQGTDVSLGEVYNLNIPLLSQDNRFNLKAAVDVINFNVLRAGNSGDSACLGLVGIVDGIGPDDVVSVITQPCIDGLQKRFQWRFDSETNNFINEIKDRNGNNFCLSSSIPKISSSGGGFTTTSIINHAVTTAEICKEPSPGSISVDQKTQKFEHEPDGFGGNKIKRFGSNLYLDINATEKVVLNTDKASADSFFTTLGVPLDQDGRLFYVGKFYDESFGDPDAASVNLNYGSETFVDYLPVIGITTQSHITLSASFLDNSVSLLNSEFSLKQHLSKKTSVVGNNYPDVVVENGAEFVLDIVGSSVDPAGMLTPATITQTFDPNEELAVVLDTLANFDDITHPLSSYDVDEEIVNETIVIGFIPLSVKGGIRGEFDINLELTTPGTGVRASAIQTLSLTGYLNGSSGLSYANAGPQVDLTFIEQELDLSAAGNLLAAPSFTELTFDVNSSLDASLHALKGRVLVIATYPDICVYCGTFGDIVTSEILLYESPWLFNSTWTIFDKAISSTVISF